MEKNNLSRQEKRMLGSVKDSLETFCSVTELEAKVDEVVALLAAPKIKVVSFTGAGISASAGIPTYRGADGIDTLSTLASDPNMAYKASSGNNIIDLTNSAPNSAVKDSGKDESDDDEDVDYTKLRPTYAHLALARLEALGKLHGCVTQNCDNLHAKGGVSEELISDLHGNVFKEYCETCETEYMRDYCVDAFSTDCHAEPYYRKCSTCGWNHYTGRLCDTGRCRGKLRDTIVNFGDDLHLRLCGGLMRAKMACRCADVCLTLGTSLTVYPASELPLKARKLVIVNLQATDLDEKASVRVWATCDDFFRMLMPKLEAALLDEAAKAIEVAKKRKRVG
jgi:mono-ADP-ribosyltransferase sirtuin 6